MNPFVLRLSLALFSMAAVSAQMVNDFHLKDVGQNSPRNGATISPRQYLYQVSAYYFGDAG